MKHNRKNVTIGYFIKRSEKDWQNKSDYEEGEFRILATMSNAYGELTQTSFDALVDTTAYSLQGIIQDYQVLVLEREDVEYTYFIDGLDHNGEYYDLELCNDGAIQINGLHDVTAASFTDAVKLIQEGNV